MTTTTPSLKLLMNLAIAHSITSRRFDGRLGSLGFTEFLILFHLEQTPQGKMRRVDLAEQVGLTASGITRLLAPMEKIGLVKREADKTDARVSFVAIAEGGKRMLQESMENAEELAARLLTVAKRGEVEHANRLLVTLGGTVR
jgi:DNA-binding MarR family transcriptional regulator